MATCAECVHVDVCHEFVKELAAARGLKLGSVEEISAILQSDDCEQFKDRSRFVELPCKVGDTVYCSSFGKLMEDEIKCITIDANETRMVFKRGISFDIDFINQMFFFTREEAEQVLKGREGNA